MLYSFLLIQNDSRAIGQAGKDPISSSFIIPNSWMSYLLFYQGKTILNTDLRIKHKLCTWVKYSKTCLIAIIEDENI